ncbi:mitochondrial carrier domain-containing protein [Gloeopeniophorella convolvens]|nr:mitochondrial carrier domain-containing protein [Gloeopeniophorella convolvens]
MTGHKGRLKITCNEILIAVPHSAANDFWGKTFKKLFGEAQMTQKLSILMGCSAEATESFVVVPFELVKIKQAHFFPLRRPLVTNPFFQQAIMRKDGLLGLYAGMEATFWRYVALWTAVRCGACYRRPAPAPHGHLWWNGGYFGTIFQVQAAMLPKAEVVKSRIQGAEKIPGVVPKHNWTYPGIVTIFCEEGPAALYKDFVPKVLWLAPGGGVLPLVVEFTLGVFRKALGPPYI